MVKYVSMKFMSKPRLTDLTPRLSYVCSINRIFQQTLFFFKSVGILCEDDINASELAVLKNLGFVLNIKG